MGLSVGKVAKMFNLSRTTLLYYDSIGLLSPSDRSSSGYRIYSDSDIEKLRQIVLYKDVGVPLIEIDNLITASENDFVSVLMQRLNHLNKEISIIKKKQEVIVSLLRNVNLCKEFPRVNKELWKELLDSVGMTKEQAMQWHADFEQYSPEQHQHLLTAIGIQEEEIRGMREYFRNYTKEIGKSCSL